MKQTSLGGKRVSAWRLRCELPPFFVGSFVFIPSLAAAMALLASLAPHRGDGTAIVPPWMLLCLPLFAGLIACVVVRRIAWPRAIVGSDGIRIVGVLRQTFVSYDDVKDVEELPNAVRLHRTQRDAVDLLTAPRPDPRGAALARSISNGLRASRRSARGIDALGRQGRSFSQWKEEVIRIARSAGTFREPSFDREELLALLESGGAPADQRIGAAFALRALERDDAAPRIRVAVSATANERLRAALDAIVSDDDREEALVVQACDES